MYTEIELSEFAIRARIKLGDFALEASNATQVGENVEDIIAESTVLRVFLNSLHSQFNNWSPKDKYRRMEYFAYKHKLQDRPAHGRDWLDKFKGIPTLVSRGQNCLELPEGTGFVYVDRNIIRFVQDTKLRISSLPLE